jgi:hypothetical protein
VVVEGCCKDLWLRVGRRLHKRAIHVIGEHVKKKSYSYDSSFRWDEH